MSPMSYQDCSTPHCYYIPCLSVFLHDLAVSYLCQDFYPRACITGGGIAYCGDPARADYVTQTAIDYSGTIRVEPYPKHSGIRRSALPFMVFSMRTGTLVRAGGWADEAD